MSLSLRVRSPVIPSVHDVLFVRFISSSRCCHVIRTRPRKDSRLKKELKIVLKLRFLDLFGVDRKHELRLLF